MRRSLINTGLAIALLASTASAANAVVIDRTYTFTASRFSEWGSQLGLVAPIDTVTGSFTLRFDTDLGDQTDESFGFVMHSLSMPVTDGFPDDDSNATIGWNYRPFFDSVTVGGMYQGVGTLSKGAYPNNDFYLSVDDYLTAAPTFSVFRYASKSANAFFEAGSLSMTITSNSAAPEPAAWALMLVGFGGAGAVLRRRRKMSAFAV